MRAWFRAVRVHQWAKNGLLLLPAIAAHVPLTSEVVVSLLLAVGAFSALASAVYLLNDFVDLENDRTHPRKRYRPLAAGEIAPRTALVVACCLAALGLLLALQLPTKFLAAWAAYLVLTTGYTFILKRVVVLDVVVLAGLYTLRVIAGAVAVQVPLSRWFLAFGVLLFLSLALLKRFVETRGLPPDDPEAVPGRGYQAVDVAPLLSLGTASGVVSALVYCLYITSTDALRLYTRPDVLWLGLPLFLYWLARIWILANRGVVQDDPLVHSLRDPISYVVFGLFAATVMVAA